ncbi:STAS domain-containing protein [Actinoplanes sp. NPDC026619]|uniref:STAS domain-containing protein n=1 Tax=Actinoplanes sp. NPDC026619 TaxID=3155798 RepID=UPI0033E968E8
MPIAIRPASVVGELDMATTPALRDRLFRLTGPQTRNIVLDLSQCTLIDATALTVFVRLHEWLSEHGGRLIARNPSELIARILRMTHVDDIVEVKGATAGPAAPGRVCRRV